MEPFRIIIGLEVHVQLLSKTKLFCGCSTQFGLPPNTATCPVCLGLPGALPVMNRRAFELSLKAAMALNCEIASYTKWDRKQYYYPDLPKNYQISQYDLPVSHDGWLDVETGGKTNRIGIIRVHLEEDAGKMMHDEEGRGRGSRVDLNRTGTPLLEIVSRPDIRSPAEAKSYLEEIRLIMRNLGISDCEMQEGSLRCDANINLHIQQTSTDMVATPIVEVKNLNSFRAVERALNFEAGRQFEEFQKTGRKIGDPGANKATAGWNEVKGETFIQRRKEEASDYRYFPDPDLVPVIVDAALQNRIRAEMSELPAVVRQRLQEQYGLSPYDAGVLTRQGNAFVAYFEETARHADDAKVCCNWLTNQIMAILNERKIGIAEFPLPPARLGDLICTTQETGLNKKKAQNVLQGMLQSNKSAEQAMNDLGYTVISDEAELRRIVRAAVAANPKAVAAYHAGKTKAIDAVKGAIMRQTKGLVKFELVQQLLVEALADQQE